MSLADDLKSWVADTFTQPWEVQQTAGVPDPQDLRLNSNHAKDLVEATVLYADLDGSTDMVNSMKWEFSAHVYKTFLKCASDVIKAEGGLITAYDGDRVMAVFTGTAKNTSAARCALKINHAVKNIIQPAISTKWKTDFVVRHVVGIDTSQLRATRIGIRGDNDIVWVGRAANYAAKLTNFAGVSTRITQDVYNALNESSKTSFSGESMWTPHYSPELGIWTYISNWTWTF